MPLFRTKDALSIDFKENEMLRWVNFSIIWLLRRFAFNDEFNWLYKYYKWDHTYSFAFLIKYKEKAKKRSWKDVNIEKKSCKERKWMEKLVDEKLFEKFPKWKKWCLPFKELLQKKHVKYIMLIGNKICDIGNFLSIIYKKKQRHVDSNNFMDFNKFQSREF